MEKSETPVKSTKEKSVKPPPIESENEEPADKEYELIRVYTSSGKPTKDKVTRKEAHSKGIFHAVVHIWISDKEGRMICAQRSKKKINNPGLYDISAAGHIVFGETPLEGAVNEIREELGLEIKEEALSHLGTFCIKKKVNEFYFDNEIVYLYNAELEKIDLKKLKLQECEVGAVGLMTWTGVKACYENDDSRFVKMEKSYFSYFSKFVEFFTQKYPQVKESKHPAQFDETIVIE